MVGDLDVRNLVDHVLSTGRRHDTGPIRAPEGGDKTQFVTLVKPEALSASGAVDSITEVLKVLREGEALIVRCALMPAREYLARGSMLLHYPRLHRVAIEAANGLCSDARRKLSSFMASTGAIDVLGAFEVMAHDAELSPALLENRCRQAGIHKLGSGSYVSAIEVNGRVIAVLNGFLPALAKSYANTDSLVGVLECHSRREIADLRSQLLGDLDPSVASRTSLRGVLGELINRQQGTPLSEGRNGVHLSAGHLEGMFQAWMHFAASDGRGLDSTLLGRSLSSLGVSMESVAELITDPNLPDEFGETVSPHGSTENLSRGEVLTFVRQWTADGRGFAA